MGLEFVKVGKGKGLLEVFLSMGLNMPKFAKMLAIAKTHVKSK